jgi:MSHA pilin protein MshD
MFIRHRQHGISLVELIMFIVIVGVALAGILLVMNVTTKNSADPLIHKQALAIAESLLEEVELMPFTYCDPDDPAAVTANSTTDCTAPAGGEAMGPETGETRYSTPAFDNVNDYNNFHMTPAGGIQNITNTTVLTGYDALVTITQPGLSGIAGAETLLINVTVTGPDNFTVTLEGFRTRYSPRTVP